MSTFVYKVNPKGGAGHYSGDWFVFFSRPQPCGWGLAEIVCTQCHPQPGDRIICYQTNMREVVGTAQVVGYRLGKLVLHATEGPFARGIKITELKKIDRRIRELDAFKQGLIKTLYPISDGDADHLLDTIKRFWVDAGD
jgi:hypothetical protein